MSQLEFRPLREDEFAEAVHLDAIAFGEQHASDDIPHFRQVFDFERSRCAFDQGRLVATTTAFALRLTLPGGRFLPVAGITWVAVLPTHRRRGILTRLMRAQLEDAEARGEAGAVLIASEGGIYGRFGLGPATSIHKIAIDRAWSGFRRSRAGQGAVSLLSAEEAAWQLPPLFDEVRSRQAGEVSRSAAAWVEHLRDPEQQRQGASAMLHVLHADNAGRPDGYVSYRVKEDWSGMLAANEVRVVELMAVEPGGYAALWEYLLSLDLARTITFELARIDEPVRWLLTDPRALRTEAWADYLWLRLLDLPGALAARSYRSNGEVVLELEESFPEARSSCLLLSVDQPGMPVRCLVSDLPPHLRLDVSDLATAYLGGVSFSTLAAAGRVQEYRAGALEVADRLFATGRPPYCATMF